MKLAERLGSIATLLPDGGTVMIPVCELRQWVAEDGAGCIAAPAVSSKTDQWLTAEECSAKLHVSTRWCYDHAMELGARKLSRRCVRFSEKALERYMARRT
jgi:hypothetical protein